MANIKMIVESPNKQTNKMSAVYEMLLYDNRVFN